MPKKTNSPAASNPRAQAALLIASVIPKGESGARSLTQALNEVTTDNDDAGLIKELCYGVIRQRNSLNDYVKSQIKKPLRAKDQDVHCLLLVGVYQLLHTRVPDHAAISETVAATHALKKKWAKGLVNAVLRNIQKSLAANSFKASTDPSVVWDHPSWLITMLQADWPQHYEGILTANNQPGPMTLRVNAEKTQTEAYLAQLNAEGIAATKGSHSSQALYLTTACAVSQLPNFDAGWVSVQDEAAQMTAELLELKPGERVLDACAAPGGKTCHILEACPQLEQVVALELEASRTQLIVNNLHRLHSDKNNVSVKVCDALELDAWWDQTAFDKILLDVPCSATGVIRRHPDIKWLRRKEDILALQDIQSKLLQTLWTVLKPGGTLVYSTCSLLKAENEMVIERFLNLQSDASLYKLTMSLGVTLEFGQQSLPTIGGADGFYYARLRKKA